MTGDPLHPPLESVLDADGAALRRLARGLLARDDVDDAVQDAALAALAAPHGPRNDIGGWLRGVVRNLAAMRHRAETRRRARERAVAAPALAPPEVFDPATLAVHAETTAAVSEAVRALDEPYRSVVVLRFWHGRSTAEIARHLGVPHDTVRSRLQRGLDRLRLRLDARFGARDRWSAPLLALAGRAAPTTAATTSSILTTTGVLMKTKWILAATAAVAAAILLPLSLREGKNPPGPDDAGAGIVAENASRQARAQREDSDAGARRVAEPPAAAVPAVAPRDHVLVRGRCVDGDGKAVAGCTATVQTRLPLAHEPTQPIAAGASDPGGRFELTFVPLADSCTLSLRANGFATVQCQWEDLRTGSVHELGDVVLPRGGGVAGRVVDGRGQPLPGIAVALYGTWAPTPSMPSPQATIDLVTDADGGFAASALAPGEWTAALMALRYSGAPRASTAFTVERGDVTTGIELVYESVTGALRGVVVDAAGAPLAAAEVECTNGLLRAPIRCGPDGRFTVLRKAPDESASVGLLARAPGFDPSPVRSFPWNAPDLRIELRRCAVAWLLVVREDGTPVQRYAVRVAQSPGTANGMVAQSSSPLLPREHGRTALEGLPRGDYVAWIDPGREDRDGAARELAPFLGTFTIGGDPEHVRWRAPREGARTVLVVDASQKPVVGTRLELVLPVRSIEVTLRTPAASPEHLAMADALRVARATTDAVGAAELRAASGTEYTLRVLGPGHRPQVVRGMTCDDATGPLVVTVDTGASVFGTVSPPEVLAGLGASEQERDMVARFGERGATLLQQWQPQVLLRPIGGGADYPVQATDGAIALDGTYRIDGVPPGSWQVCLRLRVRVGDGGSMNRLVVPLATVRDLQSGEERRIDLDCTAFGRGSLHALVLVDGEPLRNAPVSLLYRRDGQQFGATTIAESAHRMETDAEGRLRVEVPPGEWAVEAEVEGRSAGQAKLRNEQIAIVAPGATTECTFALQRRVLRVRIVRPDGMPEADRKFSILQQRYMAGAGSTDAEGRLVLESMPTGAFDLVTWPVELSRTEAQTAYIREHPYPQWLDALIRLGPVSLPAGHTEGEIELRMPR